MESSGNHVEPGKPDNENNVDSNRHQQSEIDTKPKYPENTVPNIDELSASVSELNEPFAGVTIDSTMKSLGSTVLTSIEGKRKNETITSGSSTSIVSYSDPPLDLLLKRPVFRKKKVDIYTEPREPRWHDVQGSVVTRPLIPTKIPEAFNALPIFGIPFSNKQIPEFENNKIREFVGGGLSDEEFAKLAEYCSPDLLKTGNEIKMPTTIPTPWSILPNESVVPKYEGNNSELCIMKKNKLRMESDSQSHYIALKYRGMRMTPLMPDDYISKEENLLEPGKDLLFRARIYRPYVYGPKEKNSKKRHSVLSRDVYICGRQPLAALRDAVVCHNDQDLRLDVSTTPDEQPTTCAKDLFPSGFMFVNNVCYTDRRPGCRDLSAVVRDWALERGMGEFRCEDIAEASVQDLVHVLGHPEVYVHQGSCEHVFTFSEVRLVTHRDPLRVDSYPCSTIVSQNHTIYCTTCAEFGAKWIVTGCDKVPFDPAYFCDTCFRLYMYKDGKKMYNFKAYSYMGNDLNAMKPT